MKLDFEVVTEEGPYKFYGELSKEEMEVLLEFAVVEMLRRGFMPMDADKASRMQPSSEVKQ